MSEMLPHEVITFWKEQASEYADSTGDQQGFVLQKAMEVLLEITKKGTGAKSLGFLSRSLGRDADNAALEEANSQEPVRKLVYGLGKCLSIAVDAIVKERELAATETEQKIVNVPLVDTAEADNEEASVHYDSEEVETKPIPFLPMKQDDLEMDHSTAFEEDGSMQLPGTSSAHQSLISDNLPPFDNTPPLSSLHSLFGTLSTPAPIGHSTPSSSSSKHRPSPSYLSSGKVRAGRPTTKNREFECEQCGKTFTLRTNLTRHKKNDHPM